MKKYTPLNTYYILIVLSMLCFILLLFSCEKEDKNNNHTFFKLYTTWPYDSEEAVCRQIETAKSMNIPKNIKYNLGNSKIELVLIPAGKFVMGSPEDELERRKDEVQHEVTLTNPFYIGIHEVTVGQFKVFVEDTDYKTEAEKTGIARGWTGNTFLTSKNNQFNWKNLKWKQTDDHPVGCIDYVDAQAFCKWLSQKTGKVFRLPTEAEWEYAARAGVAEAYLWGSDPQKGEGWANIWDVATQKRIRGEQTIFKFKDDYMYTSPVGSFKPNAFGLYDVIGNIMEWCSDYYGEYLDSPQTNPKGPLTGEKRIIRSSSWITSSRWDRLASRNSLNSPTHSTCGFRIVMNAEPARASEEEESGISLWWIWLLVAILIIGIVFMKYRSYQRKNMSKNHN